MTIPQPDHGAVWPALIEQLLGRRAAAGSALGAAVETAAKVGRATAVQVVEWVRARPTAVHIRGEPPPLSHRPRPGAHRIGDRPVVVVRLDDHRDLIAAREPAAECFSAEEVAGVQAVAVLLGRSADLWRRDAAETLHRLTREIVGTLDLDRVLLTIANTSARLLASEVAGVFLAHGPPEARELRMRCVVGHRTPETARLRMPAGRGMAGKVLETGRPARVDDYRTDREITKDFLGIAMEEGTQSGLAVPMRDAAGVIIGVLAAWRMRPSVYSDEDEALLVALANLAAIGLVNARMYEDQQRVSAELEAARRELEGRLQVSDEALEIHQRLTAIAAEGHDLTKLAEAVHGLVNGSVVIVPTADRVPAQWPPNTEPPCREHEARAVREAMGRGADGTSPMWVRVQIEAAGVRHGVLYARLPAAPRPIDVLTLEQSATICALLLGHEDAVAAAIARLRSEFVWELLEGRSHVDQDESTRAMALGVRLTFPARILLLRARGLRALGRAEGWTAEEAERNRVWLAARVASTVSELTGHVVPVAHRDEHVVALLGAADPAARIAEAALRRSPFPSVCVQAGISRASSDVESLPQALHEARVALSAVNAEAGRVVRFEDLGVLQFLIAPSDADDLHRFATEVLGRLQDYDRRHAGELLPTLDRYFENGCNSARTARAMRVHPKTLAYRLRRIAEVGGLDLNDRQARLDAELALRILGPSGRAAENGS